MSYPAPTSAGENAVRDLLADLAGRKEFCAYGPTPGAASPGTGTGTWPGFGAGPTTRA